MNRDVSAVLRSLEVGVESITNSKLQLLFQKLPAIASDEDEDKVKNTDEEVDVNMDLLQLSRLQFWLDKFINLEYHLHTKNHGNLDNIITGIESYIVDFKTATDSLSFYNLNWFSELLMSDEDKSLIASHLLDNIIRYAGKSLDTEYLVKIKNLDTTILNKIRFPLAVMAD